MTITRASPGAVDWPPNAEIHLTNINQLDTNPTYALDKRSGQTDTLASVIALSGAGRFVPTRATGANANTVYRVDAGNAKVQITSTVTASRTYTLSTAGAVDGDKITFFCDTTFLFEVTLSYGAALPIILGNIDTSDSAFATFHFAGPTNSWILCGGLRARPRTQTFTASGTWVCPPGVTTIYVEGCGGGGGGGSGANSFNQGTQFMTGGGGGGASIKSPRIPLTVTPGTTYTITIGGGGNGGVSQALAAVGQGSPGSPGGDTKFDVLATFPGASGGMGGVSALSSIVLGGCAAGSGAGKSVPSYPQVAPTNLGVGSAVLSCSPGPGTGGSSATPQLISISTNTTSLQVLGGGNGATSLQGYAGGQGGRRGVLVLGSSEFPSSAPVTNGGGGGAGGPGGAGGAGGNGAVPASAASTTPVSGLPGSPGLGFGAGGGGGGGGSGPGGTSTQVPGLGGPGGSGFGGFLTVTYIK